MGLLFMIGISLFEADLMSQAFLSHIFLLRVKVVLLNFCYCNYIKKAQVKEAKSTGKADI